MKKIVLLSHCVMNPFCELPEAPETLRKPILDTFLRKGWGIIQLPCPELCYQSLERSSIYVTDEEAAPYRLYCKKLLQPLIKNIGEYNIHGIKVGGIVGIDTSPSCSVIDQDAIMMQVLLDQLNEIKSGEIQRIDTPIDDDIDMDIFLDDLASWQ